MEIIKFVVRRLIIVIKFRIPAIRCIDTIERRIGIVAEEITGGCTELQRNSLVEFKSVGNPQQEIILMIMINFLIGSQSRTARRAGATRATRGPIAFRSALLWW